MKSQLTLKAGGAEDGGGVIADGHEKKLSPSTDIAFIEKQVSCVVAV